MGDLRATEMLFGRPGDPAHYVDSTPAPVAYTRFVNHGPASPAPYDAPPLPPYETVTPRHFLPPHEYSTEPVASITLQAHEFPPTDLQSGGATKLIRRESEPRHAPPTDMVIPGVLHPDGRFEPHPYFARRSSPGPPVEPEELEKPSKKTVEVEVPVCCEACKERITNYVGQTPGVDSVECDINEQKVIVTGDLPPRDVLQRCRKCFRNSTLV